MKKTIKILFVCCLALLAFQACKSTASTAKTAKNQPLENSMLWKITGNGLEQPSYLYGTIHLTCNYELSDKLKAAFDATDQVVLEIDMDDPGMQMKAMQRMMLQDGQTVKSMLSDEEYTKLNDFITENTGMSLDLFNGMKPFGVLSLVLAKSASCDDAVAYETEFVKIAKEQKEEVLGLETIESQIAIFDSIPYKDQLDNLLTMAEEGMDKARSDLAALDSFHKNEDLEGMYKLASETEEMTAEFSNLLLDNRNKNWIPEIGKFAKEKATFFGVGALHLPGENGVINLLRKEGYTLTAVK